MAQGKSCRGSKQEGHKNHDTQLSHLFEIAVEEGLFRKLNLSGTNISGTFFIVLLSGFVLVDVDNWLRRKLFNLLVESEFWGTKTAPPCTRSGPRCPR